MNAESSSLQLELSRMNVFQNTEVGWCASTPVNETMDGDGNAYIQEVGFAAMDPFAPRNRVYDDPQVEALRDFLRDNNGIQGLEICEPQELDRISRLFFRDGFVVVNDLLEPEALDSWRKGCAKILRDILAYPGHAGRKYITETNRLPHRYSYGTASASRQLLHETAWASMIDLPTTTPILKKLVGSSDYHVWGAGGDLCLPGAIEYQALHTDLRENFRVTSARLSQARKLGIDPDVDDPDRLDSRTCQAIVERTPPMITINFLMSDLTWENGPIRQVPHTQGSAGRIPLQSEEPMWMRTSTLVGARAGAGMIRDNRGWHGATPNLGRQVRALPDVEYGAPWVDKERISRTMPHEIWKTLSPHGQAIARWVKAEPGIWPAGAGVMHPLETVRRESKRSSYTLEKRKNN